MAKQWPATKMSQRCRSMHRSCDKIESSDHGVHYTSHHPLARAHDPPPLTCRVAVLCSMSAAEAASGTKCTALLAVDICKESDLDETHTLARFIVPDRTMAETKALK